MTRVIFRSEFAPWSKLCPMQLEVNGMGRPATAAPPAPQQPEAAPVAASPAPTAPPQTPSGMILPAPGDQVQPQTPQAPSAAPTTPIVLYGRTFQSQKQAEGYVRHLVKSAEGRKEAELERARAQTTTPTATPPAATPTPEPEPERAYDVNTYALVKSRYGEDAAEDYRSRAIAEYNRTVTQEMIDKRMAPIEAKTEEDQFQADARSLFERAAAVKGPDGITPMLPELLQNETGLKIIEIWQDLPLEFAMTPKGVHHAVMAFRGLVSGMQAPPVQPPPQVPGPSGIAIDASVGPTPGFAPGHQQPSNIPRPSAVNMLTGERFTRS